MALEHLASGWPIARIFGITIRVHLSWIIIFLLLTTTLAEDVLPLSNLAGGGAWWDGLDVADDIAAYQHAHPGPSDEAVARRFGIVLWPPWQRWVLAVVGALGLFVCVLAHELSHSVVALSVGIRVEGITLFVFGGVARIRDEARSPGAEFKVAAAGPLMSLALGGSCWVIHYLFGGILPAQAGALIYYFLFINLALVVFNLLPGFPLDGGRLLRAALWRIMGDLRQATFIASICGRILAGLLVFVGAVQFLLLGTSLGSLWWVVIGLFLWFAAKASYRQVALRETFAGLTVRDAVRADVMTVPPDLTLDRLVNDYIYAYRLRGFPVLDGETLVGMVSLSDVQSVPRGGWPWRTVAEAMQPARNGNVVALDEDLISVMRKMMHHRRNQLAVVEAGRFAGVITRDDMQSLFEIRKELRDTRTPPHA